MLQNNNDEEEEEEEECDKIKSSHFGGKLGCGEGARRASFNVGGGVSCSVIGEKLGQHLTLEAGYHVVKQGKKCWAARAECTHVTMWTTLVVACAALRDACRGNGETIVGTLTRGSSSPCMRAASSANQCTDATLWSGPAFDEGVAGHADTSQTVTQPRSAASQTDWHPSAGAPQTILGA